MPARRATTVAGRFTAADSRRALARVCARCGLDDTGAEPVKLTVNAVYRLPGEGAIVRIATSPAMTHRVAKVVQVARWLAAAGLPAVRLFPGVPAPVEVDDVQATVWVDVGPERGPAPNGADLAAVLRRLHALAPPDPPLPAWNPLDDVRRRMSDAEGLADADRAVLDRLTDWVTAALPHVRYALPHTVVHGDAHLGNLIRGRDGTVVVCDFDAVSLGPAEWDLMPVAVGRERFGYPPGRHAELTAAYGFDVTRWDGYPVLRAVRELKLVTSAVPILASSPTVAAQFRLRLDSLRDNDRTARWSRYR